LIFNFVCRLRRSTIALAALQAAKNTLTPPSFDYTDDYSIAKKMESG
jgi:hypothetical protein